MCLLWWNTFSSQLSILWFPSSLPSQIGEEVNKAAGTGASSLRHFPKCGFNVNIRAQKTLTVNSDLILFIYPSPWTPQFTPPPCPAAFTSPRKPSRTFGLGGTYLTALFPFQSDKEAIIHHRELPRPNLGVIWPLSSIAYLLLAYLYVMPMSMIPGNLGSTALLRSWVSRPWLTCLQ